MGAFDNGFNMGLRSFQQALDNKRQEELDARAKEEHGWRKDDRARADAQRLKEDGIFSAIEAENGYSTGPSAKSLAASGLSFGFGQPNPASPAAGGIPAAVSSGQAQAPTGQANASRGVFGVEDQNPAQFAGVPHVGAAIAGQGINANAQPPSRLDHLRLLERLAVVRRDAASMERLGKERLAAQEDEDVGRYIKEYNGSEEQIGSAAIYLNNTHLKITMGEVGKNGMLPLSVVKPDGKGMFMNLSKHQQAQLFAAGKLMETNPARGLQMISGVNKELGDAFDKSNTITDKVAQHQNTAAYQSGQLDLKREEAAANRQHQHGMLQLQRERLAASTAANQSGAFDPLFGFDQKAEHDLATKLVLKEQEQNLGKPADPRVVALRVQQIVEQRKDAHIRANTDRQRASVFSAAARAAQTPEQIEAVRARARASGFTDAEMAGLDPRFAPEKPAPAPSSGAATTKPNVSVARTPVTAAQTSAVTPQEDPAGVQLDKAKAELKAATDEVRRYGSVQRRDNPSGFTAAMQRVKEAEQSKFEAERAWRETLATEGLGAFYGRTR